MAEQGLPLSLGRFHQPRGLMVAGDIRSIAMLGSSIGKIGMFDSSNNPEDLTGAHIQAATGKPKNRLIKLPCEQKRCNYGLVTAVLLWQFGGHHTVPPEMPRYQGVEAWLRKLILTHRGRPVFFSECPVYETQMDWQFVACQLRVGGRVMVAESSKQSQLGFYVVSWGDRS